MQDGDVALAFIGSTRGVIEAASSRRTKAFLFARVVFWSRRRTLLELGDAPEALPLHIRSCLTFGCGSPH